MATPAIGDDIIARSKAMTSATAARARSLTTPTARDANETGSYCDRASRISVAMTRVYRPGGWSHLKSSGRASSKMFHRKRRRCSHAHTSPPGESTIWISIPIAEPAIHRA